MRASLLNKRSVPWTIDFNLISCSFVNRTAVVIRISMNHLGVLYELFGCLLASSHFLLLLHGFEWSAATRFVNICEFVYALGLKLSARLSQVAELARALLVMQRPAAVA